MPCPVLVTYVRLVFLGNELIPSNADLRETLIEVDRRAAMENPSHSVSVIRAEMCFWFAHALILDYWNQKKSNEPRTDAKYSRVEDRVFHEMSKIQDEMIIDEVDDQLTRAHESRDASQIGRVRRGHVKTCAWTFVTTYQKVYLNRDEPTDLHAAAVMLQFIANDITGMGYQVAAAERLLNVR